MVSNTIHNIIGMVLFIYDQIYLTIKMENNKIDQEDFKWFKQILDEQDQMEDMDLDDFSPAEFEIIKKRDKKNGYKNNA